MKREIVRLSSKGQLTLPSSMRKELKLERGKLLLVMKVNHELVLRPIENLSNLFGVDKETLAKGDLDKLVTKLRETWNKEFKQRIL